MIPRILKSLPYSEGMIFSALAERVDCSMACSNTITVLHKLVDAGLVQEIPVDKETARKKGSPRPKDGTSVYKLTETGLRAQKLLEVCPVIYGVDFLGVTDLSKASIVLRLFMALQSQPPIRLCMKELMERTGSKEDHIRELIKALLNSGLVAKMYDLAPARPARGRAVRYRYTLTEKGASVANELISLSKPTP